MQTETEILQAAAPLLLSWFRANQRDLPWRKNRTFYTSLVAEIMLQQTRVEAVKERYVAFLEKFPTEKELALASEDEVMKAWEGLGYYSRARNLQKAAKTLFEEGTPRTWVGVRSLAGVGDYTAGALSSIALGLKEPAVDGNVLRVLTRLLADGSVIDDGVKRKFTQLLRAVYPDSTADFCEGLMELGAIVCVPNGAPFCEKCPWAGLCRAHLAGEEERFPVRAEKKARKVEYLDVFVLMCDGRYALKKRGAGLLRGLWEFPNRVAVCPPPYPPPAEGACTEEASKEGACTEEASKEGACPAYRSPNEGACREGTPWEGALEKGAILLAKKTAKHIFTHVEWRMTGYLIQVEEATSDFVWATAEEIEKSYAIPSAFGAFTEWVK